MLKVAAIVGLIALGLFARAPVQPHLFGPVGHVPGGLLAAFGIAMIAALWTYDGWYGLTCSAGEMRDPGRSLPRGLILGTGTVILLYLLLNRTIGCRYHVQHISTAWSVYFFHGAERDGA